MDINIKVKNNYNGLIQSENNRKFKKALKSIKESVILFSITGALVGCIGWIVIFVHNIADKYNMLYLENIGLISVLIISICMIGYAIFSDYKDKKEKDKFLDELYKYLPLDKDDINRNGLVTYLDYLVCVNKLIKNINSNVDKLNIHERVRHDIADILKEVYLISKPEIADIIYENMEEIVFNCDTNEKVSKLINIYIKYNEIEEEYNKLVDLEKEVLNC